jgi:hypothetical protein
MKIIETIFVGAFWYCVYQACWVMLSVMDWMALGRSFDTASARKLLAGFIIWFVFKVLFVFLRRRLKRREDEAKEFLGKITGTPKRSKFQERLEAMQKESQKHRGL